MFNRIIKSELARGSILLLFTIGFFNFLNLLFHFISGRLLGDALYGTLAAIMGIVYIFNVPSEAIQTIMSKYTIRSANEAGKIKGLLKKGLKNFFIFGIISFIIFVIFSPLIGKFLSIETSLIILAGVIMIVLFLISVNRGILQGLKRFSSLGLNFLIEGIIKLSFSVLLILIGMQIYGALLGLIIGGLFAFLISFNSLKDIIKSKSEKADTEGIRSYSLPVIISLAAITILYSIDLILAKRFFPDLAGQYAVISMLGKIIFFGTSPIGKAMFPLVSEKDHQKESSHNLLKKSILFVFILALLAWIVYFLFPKEIISLLYGEEFLGLSSYLLLPSAAMILLSLSNIFVYYNLSIDRRYINYSLIFFVIMQITLLSIFNSSILQFMIVNIIGNALFFIFLLSFSLKRK